LKSWLLVILPNDTGLPKHTENYPTGEASRRRGPSIIADVAARIRSLRSKIDARWTQTARE
jgi:hypothetical protein